MLDPMWPKQVELERGMVREGADRFRDRVTEATNQGQMTRLDPVRGLMEEAIPAVAKAIREWARTWEKAHVGGTPIALPHIKEIDPYVAAMLGLRAVLDGMTTAKVTVTGVAMDLGRILEHEQQIRRWENREKGLFYAVQKKLDDNHSTAAHRRRVNINRFNALLTKGLFDFEWRPWTELEHLRVGMVVIDCIIRTTQWFEVRGNPSHDFKHAKNRSPALVLTARPHMVEWLGKQLDAQEVSSPAYKPTVIPPKRWEGTRVGGYFTPYIKVPRLIRFKANQESQQARAADEFEALDMPQVYEALHHLQEVPWRVNKRVYAVMEAVISKDLGLGGVPVSAERELLPKPPGFDTTDKLPPDVDRWRNVDPEAAKVWKRSAAQTYAFNAKNISNLRTAGRILRVAHEYKDFERFYFPYMLDFRGRAYPIPVGLSRRAMTLHAAFLSSPMASPLRTSTPQAGWPSNWPRVGAGTSCPMTSALPT